MLHLTKYKAYLLALVFLLFRLRRRTRFFLHLALIPTCIRISGVLNHCIKTNQVLNLRLMADEKAKSSKVVRGREKDDIRNVGKSFCVPREHEEPYGAEPISHHMPSGRHWSDQGLTSQSRNVNNRIYIQFNYTLCSLPAPG